MSSSNQTAPSPSPVSHHQHPESSAAASNSNSSGHNNSSVIVGVREQLVALRRNLPTHAELLRVCEQFPEEGDRLSAYVRDVEQKIAELEAQRKHEHRTAQRRRHEIALQTAKELEKQKVLETEEKFRARETTVEKNQREARREREREKQEKLLQESANQEALKRFRKRRELEIMEDAQARLEHWYEAIDHAQEAREKHREEAKRRMEAEQREWQKRVEESRVKRERRLRSRAEEVQDRNSRLSHLAQHKHDLAIQARLRQETGKEEKTQIIRAAVRRNEASKMAQILNTIEESETRHEQIVGEQKQLRAKRFAALRSDREKHMKLARDRLRKLEEEREDKRTDFVEKQERDQRRHLNHRREIRQQIQKRIHETNEKRSRAHNVVQENREAELEEAARKILMRTAKVGATVGVELHPAHNGQQSLLDEEMSRARETNTFRLNMDNNNNTSKQRRHLDTTNYDDDDQQQPGVNKKDPRSKPAILRMANYSPKAVSSPTGEKDATSVELFLEPKPLEKKKMKEDKAKERRNFEKAEEKARNVNTSSELDERERIEEAAIEERAEIERKERERRELEERRKREEQEKKEKEEREKAEKEEAQRQQQQQQQQKAEESEKKKEDDTTSAIVKTESSTKEEKDITNQQQKQESGDEEKKTVVNQQQPEEQKTPSTTEQENKSENNIDASKPSSDQKDEEKNEKKEEEKPTTNNQKEETTTTSNRHTVPEAAGTKTASTTSKKFRALIIANSNNKSIPNSSSDAATVIAMLQNILGSEIFNERQILIDDDQFLGKTSSPTKDSILAAFDWLVKESKPGDSCLVYYFGQDLDVATVKNNDNNDEKKNDAFITQNDFKEKLLLPLAVGTRCTIISNTISGKSVLGQNVLPVNWEWKEEAQKYVVSQQDNNTNNPFFVSSTSSTTTNDREQQHQRLITCLSGRCINSITNSISEVLASKISSEDGRPHVRFGEFLSRCHYSCTKHDETGIFDVATSFTLSSNDTEFTLV